MKQKTPKPEPRATKEGKRITRQLMFRSPVTFPKTIEQSLPHQRQQLEALRHYFAYRHNGFVLAEALDLCVQWEINPPARVLIGINEGLQRFSAGSVTLSRALSLTKRDQQEYRQYRAEHEVMGEVRRRVNQGQGIADACRKAARKHRQVAGAVEKQYHRFWKGFFDYVKCQ